MSALREALFNDFEETVESAKTRWIGRRIGRVVNVCSRVNHPIVKPVSLEKRIYEVHRWERTAAADEPQVESLVKSYHLWELVFGEHDHLRYP